MSLWKRRPATTWEEIFDGTGQGKDFAFACWKSPWIIPFEGSPHIVSAHESVPIARCSSERVARHVVWLHNQWLRWKEEKEDAPIRTPRQLTARPYQKPPPRGCKEHRSW